MYTWAMPMLVMGAATNGLVGVDEDLEAMAAVARMCGLGPPIVVREATLAEVRRGLAELLARTEAGAPVVVYLTGHGGCVTNRGYDFKAARPGQRRLHYFRTLPGPGGADEALFEVEVALWCARLAARTANVVVIVDSCHASGLVRDEADDAAFVAAFEAWCDAHDEEIGALAAEAHPDVVRLSAAGVHGLARPGTEGSALTTCLLAALGEPGGLQRSWWGLFERIGVHMATAGVPQSPRLSGPVRRQVFTSDRVEEEQEDGVAEVRRLLAGGGTALRVLRVQVSWGRVRDGACAPVTGAAEVREDEPLYVRVANEGQERRFIGVFWVSDDGEIVLLSGSESMGVELDEREVYILGDRPFARAPRGVIPPRRPGRAGQRRGERLVVIAAEQRQALWSTVPGAGEGRRFVETPGVEILHIVVVTPE